MSKPTNSRTFVMGDIHGNLKALDQCLKRSGFSVRNDILIQLGDVSDRYPDTALVVERLLGITRLIAITGNHDEWTRDWLENGISDATWLKNGGEETISSYKKNMNQIDKLEHIEFFTQKQQYMHVDERNRLFVHGGFQHRQSPAYDSPINLCTTDRSLWRNALEAHQNSKKPNVALQSFHEIFIGHTPTLNWNVMTPMNAFNVWNLDTGAGTGGKLTIMDIESKEYWQSDHVKDLYS